ncbi:MAG: hypothetical protein HYY14_05930, partial [Candidatus Omnitrophica bacterium]|nr:hypothetical protein [Candidatus Omnitrophota bacterium]
MPNGITLEYETGDAQWKTILDVNGSNSSIIADPTTTTSFPWRIPSGELSTTVTVKISETGKEADVNSSSLVANAIIGSLFVNDPDSADDMVADKPYTIDYTQYGGITNFKIDYHDGTQWLPIVANTTDIPYQWPSVDDNISATVRVKVTDAGNPDVWGTSSAANNRIIGDIRLDYPNGSETLDIGKTFKVQWTKWGSIGNVKIEWSKDDFGSSVHEIDTNIPAGAAGGDVAGSYIWTPLAPAAGDVSYADMNTDKIQLRVTSIGGIPVTDKNPTTNTVIIRGVIKNVAPVGTTWYKGDTTRAINWEADGDITTVDILYKTTTAGSFTKTVVSGSGGHGDGAGQTYTWPSVADEKSEQVWFRVRDNGNINVYDDSDSAISIKPLISVSSPGSEVVRRVAANYTPGVVWSLNGSTNVTTVDVKYSTTGSAPYSNVIQTEVDASLGQVNWNNVANTISSNVVVQVLDVAGTLSTEVAGYSQSFNIFGNVSYNYPVASSKWRVNATDKAIDWNGKVDGSVGVAKIYVDYGTGYETDPLATVDVNGSNAWPWNPIPDKVGNSIKVKIVDVTYEGTGDEANNTWESSPFVILADFNWAASPNDPEGQVAQVINVNGTNNFTVGWQKLGTAATAVELAYTIDDGATTVINSNISNTGSSGANINYVWDLPETFSSDNVKLLIASSTPAQPDSSRTSGQFVVVGYLNVTAPTTGNQWIAGATSTITWDMAGELPTVKVYYARDGSSFSSFIVSPSTDADNVTPGAAGSLAWNIPTDLGGSQVTSSGAVAKVRVEDTRSSLATYITDDSLAFMVKGVLVVDQPDGTDLQAGQSKTLQWTRTGRFEAVNIYYSSDNAAFGSPTTIDTGVSFDFGVAVDTIPWTVPQTVGTGSAGTAYAIKVVDALNSATLAVSPTFRVQGKLDVTQPDTALTWNIGTTGTITWNIDQGNIQNVKILGSLDGTFDPGTTFTIAGTPQDADNVTTFVSTATPRGQGSYGWNIQELSPSIIGTSLKVKVYDAATGFDVSNVSGDYFEIQGRVDVDTPAVDWQSGETNHNITWTTYGVIGNVKIEFYNGASWSTVEATTASVQGANSYSITNWDLGGSVPDERTLAAKLKVTQLTGAGVSDESGTFYVYPKITNVTVDPFTDSPGSEPKIWRAEQGGHIVRWNDVSAKITAVDIVYSLAGAGSLDVSSSVLVGGNDVASTTNGANSATNVTAPITVSKNLSVRVQDSNTTYDDYVFGVLNMSGTDYFWNFGKIVIGASPGANDDYFVGTTDRTVTWTGYGNLTNVEIHYNYGTGYTLLATVGASAGTWTWEDPGAGVGVNDTVSETVTVRVRDANADADRKSNTLDVSPSFQITGSFSNLDVAFTPVISEQPVTVTWNKVGSAITDIILQYSLTGGAPWTNILDVVGSTMPNSESFTWTPKVTDLSNAVKLRITDPDNSAAEDTSAPNFTVASKIVFLYNPSGNDRPNVTDSWDANDTYSIKWTKYGTFANVKIYYSASGNFNDTQDVDVTGDAPSNNIDANHGYYDWFVTGITLSPTAKIKVIDANNTFGVSVPSAAFTTKGALQVNLPAQVNPDNYEAGIAKAIQWTRFGNIQGVDVFYSDDGGLSYPPANQILDDYETWTGDVGTFNWTPPQTPINSDYHIMVADMLNDNIFDVSPSTPTPPDPGFVVKGRLSVTSPTAASTWVVGQTVTIKWNVTQGNIATVKIQGTSNGLFPGQTFDIAAIPQTADNDVAFSATTTPRGKGYFEWNVQEQATSIIDIATSFKVRIYDPNYSVETTSDAFLVTGDLAITEPTTSTEWKIGETNRQITWNALGKLGNVKVEFYNGSSWSTVEASTASVEGANTYVVSNWDGGGSVPDVKTYAAQVRITQIGGSAVQDVTGSFKVYPIISNVQITPTVGGETGVWRALSESQEVTWTEKGTIGAVDIRLSTAGAGGFPGTLLVDGETTNSQSTAITVPATLTTNAMVRVQDDQTTPDYSGYVLATSGTFKIFGNITYNAPTTASKWQVGTTQTVSWNTFGAIGQAKLFPNYGSGYEVTELTTVDVDTVSSYAWNIPDKVGNSIHVKLVDVTYEGTANEALNSYESGTFAIVGGFDWTQNVNDPDGQVFQLTDPTGTNNVTVGWQKLGTGVTAVEVAYDVNNAGTWPVIDATYDNTGTSGADIDFVWDLPKTVSSNNVKLRVRQATPATTSTDAEDISGQFVVVGDVTGVNPPTTGTQWIAGNTSTVQWTIAGQVSTVKVLYAVDGATYNFAISSTTDADNETAGQAGSFPWPILADVGGTDFISSGAVA